jgi:hypothetical protein
MSDHGVEASPFGLRKSLPGKTGSTTKLLALGAVQQRLAAAFRLAACLSDPRARERVRHELKETIRARMLMIAPG